MGEEATIDERGFQRLAAVPRATRQDWAARRLTGVQRQPYPWRALAEVTALRTLRTTFDLSEVLVLWPQLRSSVDLWSVGDAAELLVDVATLQVTWCPSAETILGAVRAGRRVQMLNIEPALREARTGFDLAAAALVTQ